MTTRQSEPDGEKGDLLKRLFMLIATLFILSATTIIVLASGAFNGEGEALDTTFVREIATLGGEVDTLVSPHVQQRLMAKVRAPQKG